MTRFGAYSDSAWKERLNGPASPEALTWEEVACDEQVCIGGSWVGGAHIAGSGGRLWARGAYEYALCGTEL